VRPVLLFLLYEQCVEIPASVDFIQVIDTDTLSDDHTPSPTRW